MVTPAAAAGGEFLTGGDSPRLPRCGGGLTQCNSVADSKVWMGEDDTSAMRARGLLPGLFLWGSADSVTEHSEDADGK